MVRIKDVPDFYDKLHALETLHHVDDDVELNGPRGHWYAYGLDGYERDSPELIALRASLGIVPKPVDENEKNLINDKPRHGIHRERFNDEMLRKKISQPQLAEWLPITYYSLVMKLRRDTFYMREIFLIENLLGLKEGYLLIPTEMTVTAKREAVK